MSADSKANQRRYDGSRLHRRLLFCVQCDRMLLMHRALRRELIRMAKRDRDMRVAYGKGKPWDWSIDRQHTRRMKQIVRTFGWPTLHMVGKRGTDAAWYLVQHADHDVTWQERCLTLVRVAMRRGQATPKYVAMLTDRVLVNRGKRQRYGSQWYTNAAGVFGPRPIMRRASLNKRRKQMGLLPFDAYERRMRKLYRSWKPKSA